MATMMVSLFFNGDGDGDGDGDGHSNGDNKKVPTLSL